MENKQRIRIEKESRDRKKERERELSAFSQVWIIIMSCVRATDIIRFEKKILHRKVTQKKTKRTRENYIFPSFTAKIKEKGVKEKARWKIWMRIFRHGISIVFLSFYFCHVVFCCPVLKKFYPSLSSHISISAFKHTLSFSRVDYQIISDTYSLKSARSKHPVLQVTKFTSLKHLASNSSPLATE